jgi:hypothetical protein
MVGTVDQENCTTQERNYKMRLAVHNDRKQHNEYLVINTYSTKPLYL